VVSGGLIFLGFLRVSVPEPALERSEGWWVLPSLVAHMPMRGQF
jgi:hypothetical protein